MLTESEILEFHLLTELRAARRFLARPEPPTGFDAELPQFTKDRLKLGRGPLIQRPDFEESTK